MHVFDHTWWNLMVHMYVLIDHESVILKGGVQGKFFWRIRFELWAQQVPLIIGETFGEVLGPRRPTVSELRPAQKLGVK